MSIPPKWRLKEYSILSGYLCHANMLNFRHVFMYNASSIPVYTILVKDLAYMLSKQFPQNCT